MCGFILVKFKLQRQKLNKWKHVCKWRPNPEQTKGVEKEKHMTVYRTSKERLTYHEHRDNIVYGDKQQPESDYFCHQLASSL